MMKEAAPNTGGDSTAPMPPALNIPPADSLSYPAFLNIG